MYEQIIRPRNFTDTATDSDLQNADNYIWFDTANKAKKLEITRLAKASEQTALTTYAENVAASIAPPFDPTRNYVVGESCTYNGMAYIFTSNHSAGAWNPAHATVSGQNALLQLTAQNALAGNVAPAFDSTRTESNKYVAGDIVSHLGFIYEFKSDHFGPWTGTDVTKIDLSGAARIRIVSTDEYLYAVVDCKGIFLFGIKKNGDIEWAKGVPQKVADELALKVDKSLGKSLIDSVFADQNWAEENVEYLKVITDVAGKILEFIDNNGGHTFCRKVIFKDGVNWTPENISELEDALRANGYSGGTGDWSDERSLEIAKPRLAIVNFSNISSMPTTKTQNYHGIMEFWDLNGNYFKKNAIMNAQGNSSLIWAKKNISVDLCNDEWIGDDTFSLKIGDWVAQDSFHIKAYYTDYFRGVAVPAYTFYRQILDTRGNFRNRTWKKALLVDDGNVGEGLGYGAEDDDSLRIDDGALCFPDGFPCLVFLNGAFYGIFSFQLKKHRDNYMMNKDNKDHIHLDGTIDQAFLTGTIDWTKFEIRNPKKLICMNGSNYDGDNPAELIDSTSESYDPTNSKHVKSAYVKSKIEELAGIYSLVAAASTTEDKKAIIEQHYDVENVIDYQIFCDVIYNVDGMGKNWQWTTWGGGKWYLNAYDLDMAFGASFMGDAIHVPAHARMGQGIGFPAKYITDYYLEELNARYAYLRDCKVISVENIVSLVDSWVKSVGLDNYQKEWVKWSATPCNNDMIVNSDYWELKIDSYGKPVISYSSSGVYRNSTTYNVGDEVVYDPSYSGAGWYYTFVCKAQTIGNKPVTKAAFRDSLWRLRNWVKQSIENMDVVYNYSEEA